MRFDLPNHSQTRAGQKRERLECFIRISPLFFAFIFTTIVWSGEPVTLHLKNGDRITGTISSEDTNRVILATAWAKEVTVPASQIAKREPPEHAKPTGAVGAGATAGMSSSPPKSPPAQLWTGEVNVGTDMGFSERNRQLYAGRAKIILAYERLKNSLDYDFSYGRTDGLLSANRMDGFAKTDFDLGRRFYVYDLGGAGYDEIRKINLRYEVGPGTGYHLIQRPKFVLNTEMGVGYQRQELADETAPQLFYYRLAENLSWQLNAKLTMDEKFEFFPRVEEVDEYRFRFEHNVRYWLLSNLSLNLTVIDQYETQTAQAVTRNDLQVRSSLGVKF